MRKKQAASSTTVVVAVNTESPNPLEPQWTAGSFVQVPFNLEAFEEEEDNPCERS